MVENREKAFAYYLKSEKDFGLLSEGNIVKRVGGEMLLCVGNKDDELKFLQKLEICIRGFPVIEKISVEYRNARIREGRIDIETCSSLTTYNCDDRFLLDAFNKDLKKLDDAGLWF